MTPYLKTRTDITDPAQARDIPGKRLLSLAVLATALVLVPCASAASAEIHSHGEIIAVVEMAALMAAESEGLQDVEVRVRPLDQRLKPARCDLPLEIVRPHNGRALGPVSYGVQCAGSKPWTLYLRADVSAALEIPVLRRALPRGALINENDLELTRRRISTRANDMIIDPGMAVGMELIRPLPAGSSISYGQLDHPELVERGQMVTLVAGSDRVQVQMQGKAMGSGAAGDRLMVTNLSSGRRVEGVVLRDGSIRIQ